MNNKPEQWTFLGVVLTSSTVIIIVLLFIPRCFWARAPNQDSGNRLGHCICPGEITAVSCLGHPIAKTGIVPSLALSFYAAAMRDISAIKKKCTRAGRQQHSIPLYYD